MQVQRHGFVRVTQACPNLDLRRRCALPRLGSDMEIQKLDGRAVLIVEDEIVILMDLQMTFQAAGARVITASRLDQALELSDTDGLQAAVIDFALGTQDGGAVCRHLIALGVPFVFYSGQDRRTLSSWPDAPFISKPAPPNEVVDAVASIIGASQTRGRAH